MTAREAARTRRARTRTLVFAVAVGLTATVAFGVARPAAAAAGPKPKILSIRASPHALPAAGGTVTLTIRAKNTLRCAVAGQPGPFLAQRRPRTVSCRGGSGNVKMHVAANPYPMRVKIRFEVTVTGTGRRTAFELISVAEAAAAPTSSGSTGTRATGGGPLTVDTATALPTATVGTNYNGMLSASGGTPPYTWALTGGALPAGLSLGPSGDITGVPGATGSSPLTVQVTDAAGANASATVTVTVATPLPTQPDGQTSTNWSGYVVPSSGVSLTEAGGTWTVPTLNCSATPNAGVGIWVGIGGAVLPDGTSAGTLLQTGTEEDCVDGVQVDQGFTEEYPSDPNEAELFQSFPVAPGNTIKASVFQSTTGAWVTRVDNLSTGLSGELVTGVGWGILTDGGTSPFALQGQAPGLTYSAGYSAEWIVEDYATGESETLTPLADFGTVGFTGVTTSLTGWTLDPSYATTLVDANGSPLATPSAPVDGGFTVSYTG